MSVKPNRVAKYLEQSNERRGLTKEGLTPAQLEEMNKQRGLAASEKEMMEGTQKVEAFFQSVKDFFSGKVQEAEGGATNLGISTDKSSGQKDHLGFGMPQITTSDFSQMWTNFNVSDFLPDIDISQWFTDLTSDVELPDLSQMWTDFNISDFLPELNISEWLTESMTNFEMPDLSTLLPDFSSVGLTITESLSTIPTVASEMFGSISTAASEGWATIQTEWSQLSSFFDGLWSGAGDAASTAGSAIAGGINSAIGTIQSAWEGLSSWLSSKISSLASMASNAVSAVTSFVGGGGIGHNAKGTSSWRGGFTEINEQGGEIIDLPSGARIYPHATTMKMLQQDMANGELDGLGGYSSEGIGIASDMFSMGANDVQMSGFPQVPEFSAFPQAPQVGDLASDLQMDSTSTTTTNTTNNGGVTISGNTFNVRTDNDIDKIAFRLFELMSDADANYTSA